MIEKVLKRDEVKRQSGDNDTCRCGIPFSFIAICEDGKRLYYWCSRCDRNGK